MILKWFFDRTVALLGLLVLWPVLVIVAILVKIKMPKHISNKERDLLKQIQKENGGN